MGYSIYNEEGHGMVKRDRKKVIESDYWID